MRCCRHFGQLGRAMADTCAGDTGWNSGMMHRPDLEAYKPATRAGGSASSMPFWESWAVVKIAQIENFIREGEET
jgi:hypothetical protein